MCACLPTHYISQLDSFYLSRQAQSLLSAPPARAHCAPHQLTRPVLCLRSLLCDHISVYLLPVGKLLFVLKPFFQILFRVLALMKIYLFPNSAAFPCFLFALLALIQRRRDVSNACSLAAWGPGQSPLIKEWIFHPWSLCVNVSCTK